MMKIIKKSQAILLGKFSSIRDFYFFSVALGLLIVLAASVFLFNDYLNFKLNVASSVKEQNDRIKRKLSDSILYTEHTMRYIGKQVANHRAQNDYKFINDLFVGYRIPKKEVLPWTAFSWVDIRGDLVISSNYGIVKNRPNLSSRDYTPFTIKYPETIYVGKPVNGALSGDWIIPIGYGVVNQNHEYIGTVITGVLIDGIRLQIYDTVSDDNVSFVIVTNKGEEVIRSDNFEPKAGEEILEKVKSKIEENSFTYKNSYYQKLGEYPYGIVTIYSQKPLDGAMGNLLIFYLIMIFSITSFAGLVFYTFHKNFVTPISQLSVVAQQIYHGEPKEKTSEFKIAEINDLAKALDMIDDLVSKQRNKK